MKLDYDVFAFDEPALAQAFTERGEHTLRVLRRPAAHESNHRHARLLSPRRHRPRRRATEQRNEFASTDHSITSSARSRNDSGIGRPIALAVVRLMTRSNLVGCSTGMSPGVVPRRILSTSSAERRNRSTKLGP